ncbi:DUF1552 domain-containing protein [Sorangium atrum]|uniref:DUF1552 domain-containing protein n=1 Tax=Sorangium atrum TaxID=2995308 RepID=A0ABT5C584_9BACT|nr:DUF1552 domain-containing protein [Sorangium aterium]MDC0681579.1 DUF1552 domain-containing protein [Sorangium aterium]
MRRSTRRTFLRAVGASLATLPFVNMLADSVAQAGGEELPLKFVAVYHPHGIAAEYWAMRAGDTETSFDIAYENCSLQPFDDPAAYGRSFKDKILVVEGIDHLSNANGHDSAGTMLTGSRIDGKKPLNLSLDQYLAVERGLGADTRITSVALGVGMDGTESGQTLSFGAGGAPLPKIIHPVEAFNLLFAGLVVGDDPEAQARAARQRELGQSVIDFVKGDINRLRTRLAPAEQQKLDQHLTSLRELEKQYDAPSAGGPACVVPPQPDASKFPSVKQYNGGEPYFDAITDAHVDLLAQALACGITRFATLFMNDLSYANNPLGLPTDNHGSVAHTYDASPVGNDGRPGAGNPETWVPLARFNRYSYSKIARLMQRLDQLGALDSTLIYASSDMGNPAQHSKRNVPTLLAGGANGKFRMGRRIKLRADCPADAPWCGESDATFTPVTNSRILVSIAQAFGVEIESFGSQPDPALTTGALSELT